MSRIEWRAIHRTSPQIPALFLSLLVGRVASAAQALQLIGPERFRVTTMRLDVIRYGGRGVLA
jgi:hypothetical protein